MTNDRFEPMTGSNYDTERFWKLEMVFPYKETFGIDITEAFQMVSL